MKALFLFMSMMLTACGAGTHDYSAPMSNHGLGSLVEPVSFADAKDAFQRNRCVTCHSSSRHAAGIDLEDYDSAKGFARSIRAAVDDGSMPLGGPRVDSKDAAIIDAWVVSGTPP